MNAPAKPFFLQALDALKVGDRRGAASLLERELREGNTAAKNLPSVAQLAAHIGEIDLAIEASRRSVLPGELGSLQAYWATLATYGRSAEALADVERQPEAIQNQPAVLHFRGTVATQFGRFDEARECFGRALDLAPTMMASWLSLAMIKTFEDGDPELAAMERLDRQAGGDPADRAMLDYALGKACEDIGDIDRAFSYYAKGAALRRKSVQFDTARFGALADQLIREYTPENLAKLTPSRLGEQRSLFVTGLPRSGTTLTEQILLGHSAVTEGEEVNLFGAALMPTQGISLQNALTYQQKTGQSDPWGEIGRDYAHFIDMRFRSGGLVVDKSLGQSPLIGLMLQALPNARIAWLRRSPGDVALSCFRTYFATGLPWTWSLTDIADVMRIEGRLFEHWQSVFPDRILTIPYEELAKSPDIWAVRLQQHFGLAIEPAIEAAPKRERVIGTASVGQVREPISTRRIGGSAAFERHLKPFRERYYA